MTLYGLSISIPALFRVYGSSHLTLRYVFYPLIFIAEFLLIISIYLTIGRKSINNQRLKSLKIRSIGCVILKIFEVSVIVGTGDDFTILGVYLIHIHIHMVQFFEFLFLGIMIWASKSKLASRLYPFENDFSA